MKLSTAHDRSFPTVDGTFCEQCQVPWPCDAAIACEEIETLNRIIVRVFGGWEPRDRPDVIGVQEPSLYWRRYDAERLQWQYEPMTDAEAEALRPHLETP